MSAMNNHDRNTPGGFLIIDKPLEMSSARAVAIVKRKSGGMKTGHAGTLDPLATGVLVLGLGAATKSISLVMGSTKRYTTTIDLTAFTTTDDAEGERTEVHLEHPPTHEDLVQSLASFNGVTMQRPPNYSAVKVGGRRAYKLARGGATPQVKPREVIAHEITLLEYAWPTVRLQMLVGKGFYVRSLARDLGIQLGTGGHCIAIRRTAVGPFTLENAHDPDALLDPLDLGLLIDVERAISLLGV